MAPPSANLITKIKVQLKLSIARLRMLQQRDETLAKAHRRTMAQLLEAGKEDSARIRVENIIRSDITTELHEVLELYCELLLARAGLLDGPVCDPGLEEAVKSIMYAAPKTDVKELHAVRLLLAERFGKDFAAQAMDSADAKVSDKVVRKLAVAPPRRDLVQGYLEEIARAYNVDWPKGRRADLSEPPDLLDDGGKDEDGAGGSDGPGGGQSQRAQDEPLGEDLKEAKAQEELSKATPPKAIGATTPLHVNPPSPSTDNIHPKVTLNSMELRPSQKMVDAGLAKKPANGKSIDDDLAARFAALKR